MRLELEDASGRRLGTNFCWLSTHEDILDWENTEWYYTPPEQSTEQPASASDAAPAEAAVPAQEVTAP